MELKDSVTDSVDAGCLQLVEVQCPYVGLVAATFFEALATFYCSVMTAMFLAWARHHISRAAAV